MLANYLSQSINDILSIARLAPSVHNTQPWRVKVETDGLRIMLARERALNHGDPTGREIYLSLGIFTEACLISLRHNGFKPSQPKFTADEVFIKTGPKTGGRGESAAVRAMQKRYTDRTTYKKTIVPEEALKAINSCWRSPRIEVRAVNDSQIIETVAGFTRQALLLAFSNPAFRKELTEYFVDHNKIPYGIPLSALGTNPIKARLVKRLIKSGVNRSQESKAEYRRWRSASGLIFILAEGDSKSYWVESGRAYLRASLEAEKLGYSQATSAAIVEAADFHEDIEKLLGTKKRVQSVIRIGRGSKRKKYSGRLSPEELLAT